jgi:hypothetical protein
MPSPGVLDQLRHDELHEIHELNRAFLSLLQARARHRRSCLGLPASAVGALAAAGGQLLESAAAFPRALFQLHALAPPRLSPETASDFDEAEQRMCFWGLLAARQTSRQSAFQATVLFGFSLAELERLRAAALADLQQLAGLPGVLHCAFGDREWFWPRLLSATLPELRRQLTLLMFQPSLAIAWPPRRPPRSAA